MQVWRISGVQFYDGLTVCNACSMWQLVRFPHAACIAHGQSLKRLHPPFAPHGRVCTSNMVYGFRILIPLGVKGKSGAVRHLDASTAAAAEAAAAFSAVVLDHTHTYNTQQHGSLPLWK